MLTGKDVVIDDATNKVMDKIRDLFALDMDSNEDDVLYGEIRVIIEEVVTNAMKGR